ncbi:hypothetical protein CKO28_13415 [Rhodovibrio sodomensis]|uniref:Calcineurin-like phosphoesterase domain-containing protein n=1 Tax=Rhodovibrio sodomensis TaxID=1088 RepID=A0ABS1DEY1_9PROT|nr:metallophosphoesterase [Rhodovibrio sodomensis]MBK1669031.1 hypothetical protein [Rhodovibrio sodomensis]
MTVNVLFYGDPHGEWRPLFRACEIEAPDAVVLMGDMDLDEPLSDKVRPLTDAGVAVHWIAGNHDGDRTEWHDRLFHGGLEGGNLNARVADLGGVRVAGLGGVFRSKIWHPLDGDGTVRFATRAEYLAIQKPQARWRGGMPLKQRVSIFYEDFDALAGKRADVLVTHEAPSCHPYGMGEFDDLARSLGASLIVHGHHHRPYEDRLPCGIEVLGTGLATAHRRRFGD